MQPISSTSFLFSSLILSLTSRAAAILPTATLSKTQFIGRALPEFNQDLFLGIKYANQPTRFTPSELKLSYSSGDSNSGTYDLTTAGPSTNAKLVYYNATQYGYDCPAYGSDTNTLVNQGLATLNEDCHNLNIIRPQSAVDELLPVVIWIFGGGWTQGATADPRFVCCSLDMELYCMADLMHCRVLGIT
jgi:triacylglycerol lipase